MLTLLFLTTATVLLGADTEPPSPTSNTRFINAIPDLNQTALPAGSSDVDNRFCAPAAVSNSFMHFAATGYPRLLPEGASEAERHVLLAATLASDDYMLTQRRRGTSYQHILHGASGYAVTHGYKVRVAEYHGIQVHVDAKTTPVSTPPSLSWIKRGVRANAAVWLQVGWYRHDRSKDAYHKLGGHWVTLVGYGATKYGTTDDRILILRDPAPRAGDDPAHEFVLAHSIASGTVHGYGLPQPAAGYLQLAEGMHLHEQADVAILEGAVRFELAQP